MSAGTITLTNNSAAVSGAGTAFTTDLKAGDFIVSVVGGVTYTLPVKTVNSATGVTLLKNYDGPTQAGAAWSAVPREAMNAITAQLAAETAQALRGLNYDKQNWQLVFSSNGDITVRLPDGSTFSGPSWNSIVSALNEKADKSALGNAATKNTGSKNGDIMEVGAFGLGGQAALLNNAEISTPLSGCQLFMYGGGASGFWTEWGAGVKINYGGSHNFQIYLSGNDGTLLTLVQQTDSYPIIRKHYNNGNTTIDANGNLKPASPIIKLKGDGSAEFNDEAQGAMTERISKGVYKITGVLGFNSDPAWGGVNGGYVIPNNGNSLPLLWVDCDIEPDGSIIVNTFHRTHPEAPAFAQNLIGNKEDNGVFNETVKAGEPIDIPNGRWIDLRVEMPQESIWNLAQKAAQEEMEQEKTTEE
ncbi:MAG: phage tail protein [Hafnia sp.]